MNTLNGLVIVVSLVIAVVLTSQRGWAVGSLAFFGLWILAAAALEAIVVMGIIFAGTRRR